MIGDTALFRPNKRRKFQRARPRTQDGDSKVEVASPDQQNSTSPGDEAEGPAIASILKLRKQQKPRQRGIEFSNTRTNTVEEATTSSSLTLREPQPDKLRAITDRFVGHTGQVVDVDKHMFVLP